MKGAHHISVRSSHLRYELDIKRNITIIMGDSATGKTTLADMIREYVQNGSDTGISLSCDVQCRLVGGNTWKEQLENLKGCIVFIDEGNRFVASREFAEKIRHSDNYYVIITRESLKELPYSVTEIYGIHSSGKYNSPEPVYHSLYRIYGLEEEDIAAPDVVIVEDSNAGYEFFSGLFGKDIKCISAKGRDNIFSVILDEELTGSVLIIADGATFGAQMGNIYEVIERDKNKGLYLPESFEWLVLDSDVLDDPDIRDILAAPEEHIDSKHYFSWERYFTKLLTERSVGTYLRYSKSSLNPAYLTTGILGQVAKHMPEKIVGQTVDQLKNTEKS